MSQVIAIANQKGGVGKTTTAVNLASSLAARGFRVLVIDLDPQGNATTALGVDKHTLTRQTYHLLLSEARLADVTQPTALETLQVVPASIDLTGAELELVSVMARETRLKEALRGATQAYDFVLLDCPPSLGLLTINGLTAADMVLVPLQCEYYALEGLSSLLRTVELVRSSLNPRLRLGGILLTMFDRRNRLSFQVEEDVRQHFGDLVFQTAIPRNVRLSESPSHGKPVMLYAEHCAGARAYARLAEEVHEREASWNDPSEILSQGVAS